jgi:hypothetical protein
MKAAPHAPECAPDHVCAIAESKLMAKRIPALWTTPLACRNVCFLNFPYACPEPVLVKRSFLVSNSIAKNTFPPYLVGGYAAVVVDLILRFVDLEIVTATCGGIVYGC